MSNRQIQAVAVAVGLLPLLVLVGRFLFGDGLG